MTIVRGKVPTAAAKSLELAYSGLRSAGEFPPGLINSFLIKSKQEPEAFMVETIWESLEALDKMRASSQKPAAVKLFEDLGVSPTVEVFEIWNSLP
ncbi:MAG: antibiotic biosynthesis monooxygenase family protein [Nitrososphaerales archaeon]